MFIYKHMREIYEIHFIDSPDFDNGGIVNGAIYDAEALSHISDCVNTNHLLKRRLAGVLYVHDITKAKVGGVAQQNIRMLEQMIGQANFNNCTLVTTKWDCTTIPQDEEDQETTMYTEEKFFGTMLRNDRPNENARIMRFDPKTKQTAIDIITPYLKTKFIPHIAEQMVSPTGPKLALGETEAGKVVSDNLAKLAQTKPKLEKVKAAQILLAQKYDQTLFEEYKHKSRQLRRQIRVQRGGPSIMRMTIVSGAIVATALTSGPGASAFALAPHFEKAVRGQRRKEELEKLGLDNELRNTSQRANLLSTKPPGWIWNSKVQNLDDLNKDESYSLRKDDSAEDLIRVLKRGEAVGFAADADADESEDEVRKEYIGSRWDSDSDSDSGYEPISDEDEGRGRNKHLMQAKANRFKLANHHEKNETRGRKTGSTVCMSFSMVHGNTYLLFFSFLFFPFKPEMTMNN